MNTQDAERLKTLFRRVAKECNLPDHDDIAIQSYSSVIEDISPLTSQSQKEAIFLYKTRQGELAAISANVKNFRFQIVDFLIRVPDGIIKIVKANGTPLLYFYILSLLAQLLKLGTIPLNKGEIEILILLHGYHREKRKLTVDQVYEMFADKLSPVKIAEALANLDERLHCIEIDKNNLIECVEAIVFL